MLKPADNNITEMHLTLENGVEIDLLVNQRRELLGIGGVTVAGTLLRKARQPLFPLITSLRGVEYHTFRITDVAPLPEGGIAVKTIAVGRPTMKGAHADEYDVPILWPRESDPPVEDELVWLLRPESTGIEELTYRGFSYAWRFTSATEQISHVLVNSTWELGGSADGNTLLSLGQVTPPIYTAERETSFTSACLKQIKRFGDPLGMSFQLSPRYSPQQCFDFQAGPLGSLLGYWPERADVCSFVQKNPGENVFFVIDDTRFAAAAKVETPRKCLLFAPAGADDMVEHVQRNRWKDAHDFCQQQTRQLFGIKRSRPLPEATIGYDTRLMDDRTLQMRVGNDWVPSQQWLIAMADVYFPELAARGTKRVISEPIVETDPSERGFTCKLDSGIHGDLNVGSVCCVLRYRPSALWGGEAAWRYFYDKAHALGMEVGHWIGPHLSYNAPILAEHPDWMLRGVNTLSFAGGYPNFELAVLNWNTGVRAWILDDLRRWKENLGLDYIWFDSLGNLGFLPIDYAKNLQPNACAIAEFIGELQGIGIANIEVEGTSPFGISASGLFDPNQGQIRLAQDIVGQNTMDWYVGNEDMLCDQAPRIELHRQRSDEEARQIYFRCLANRCNPLLGRFSRGFGPRPDWLPAYRQTYLTVEDDLCRRTLLPDRQGVVWSGGNTRVLFSYVPQDFPLPVGTRVEQLDGGETKAIALEGGVLKAEAWSVYRMKG